MSMPEPIEFHAQFNPLIKPFLVLRFGLVMVATIVLLPLAVLWFLGIGRWWARHYFDKLDCHLSERSLRFRKGIFVQVEKTIPLENIQDVTFVEGPILRRFNLATLKFETAGGSSTPGSSEMELTGIIDAQGFRNRILAARDVLKQSRQGSAAAAPSLAAEQLAALRAIEGRLDEIAGLLRAGNVPAAGMDQEF